VAGAAGFHLLVFRTFSGAARVAHSGFNYPRHSREDILHAPEAASGQDGLFDRGLAARGISCCGHGAGVVVVDEGRLGRGVGVTKQRAIFRVALRLEFCHGDEA